MRPAAFAIPGDINTVTGGYIYERRLLEGLRSLGRDVAHIQLAASFPSPDPEGMADAVRALSLLDPERALILDGLVFGAIETAGLAQVRAPIVAMIHHPLALETGLSPSEKAYLYETERDNLRLAAHVLVPSSHTANILISEYGVAGEQITVAQPGTDRRAVSRTPTTPPLILSVGLQHPRKGHDVLLQALAKLTDQTWRAVIVGSAHDRGHAAELARLVGDLKLGARVKLAGQLSDAELDDLYAQASIFALATRYEGYGMVFDEALTWGLPIVSCATGAVPRTVPADAGILVPVDASAAFSAALRKLLNDTASYAEKSEYSARAGKALPTWEDTSKIAGEVLDAV